MESILTELESRYPIEVLMDSMSEEDRNKLIGKLELINEIKGLLKPKVEKKDG